MESGASFSLLYNSSDLSLYFGQHGTHYRSHVYISNHFIEVFPYMYYSISVCISVTSQVSIVVTISSAIFQKNE